MSKTDSKAIIYLIGGTSILANTLKEKLEIEVLSVQDYSAESCFITIFDEIKNYIDFSVAINIIIVYKNNDYHNYGFVSGLLKTVQQEYSKITGKTIGVDSLDHSQIPFLAQILDKEIYTLENEVRYKDNIREIKTYEKIKPVKKQNPIIKEGGVYLITGGAGEIGLIFARYISNTKNTRIILTGKSVLNQEKKTNVLQIPNTEYRQVDVSDVEAMKNLIDLIRSEYGGLKGIIHSAGLIRDSLIKSKNHQEIRDVFNPKLNGVKNLDISTKNEGLDFMIFFSSVAGITGNIGQSDYASANAFLDNYAEYRNKLRTEGKRSGKTISINWSLWEQGGMQLNDDSKKYIEKKFGLNTISTETGIKAFEELLNADVSQGIVTFGKVEEIYSKFILNKEKKYKNINTEISTEEYSPKDFSKLKNSVAQKLLEMTSELLKMESHTIKLDRDLGDYGLGSILLTKFSNELSNFYSIDVIPTVFYNFPTINDLSVYLVDTYVSELQNKHEISDINQIDNKSYTQEKKGLVSKKHANKKYNKAVSKSYKDSEISYKKSPIAIIGISGRLPGSSSLDNFWENIRDKKDLITEIPSERWDWKEYYGDPKTDVTKTKAKWGGFIKDIDKFDSLYFNISPREAQLMDPQQRITLETVYSALEDAGIASNTIKGSNTGVFIGVASSDYSVLLNRNSLFSEAHFTTGGAYSILANRISYLLDIHGPSEPIDTACSSSLIAIHRAVENIRNGSCNIAIAGGVNAIITPQRTLSFSQAGMLSEDGRCKTFDRRANGYVRAEGVGIVILKSLEQAEIDGDRIYGVIRSTSENHGGKANTLTSPNPVAHKNLLIKAYQDADIDPRDVSYIEAHGTGTPLGDPIEIEGLKSAFTELYKQKGLSVSNSHCGIGSVKTNIGHLEAAAGIAGILKIIYAIKNKTLPGNPNLKEVNEYLKLDNTPFYLLRDTIPWETDSNKPRIAGISSFGFGGVNAHIIIEEYISMTEQSYSSKDSSIIVLSAKDKERLKEQVFNLKKHIEENPSLSLYDIAYTLQEGRNSMEERLALIVSDKEELIKELSYYLEGRKGAVFQGNTKEGKSDFLLQGGAGQAYINYAIKNKESKSLAQLWVKGVEIDWKLLYPDQKPNKISLPTYPFLRERHWVKNNNFSNIKNNLELPSKEGINRKRDNKESKSNTLDIVRNIFADILQMDKNKLPDNADFEDLGLDSILIHPILQELKKHEYTISPNIIWEYNNIESLSKHLSTYHARENDLNKHKLEVTVEKNIKGYNQLPLHIEVLREGEYENPIFIVPGIPGISTPYSELAKFIKHKGIVYGLNWKGVLEGDEPFRSMEEIVYHIIETIDKVSHQQPIQLVGHSYGALIIFEMLKYYNINNREVKRVILIDSTPDILDVKLKEQEKIDLFLRSIILDKNIDKHNLALISSNVLKQRHNNRIDYMLNLLNEKEIIDSKHNYILKRLFTTFDSALSIKHIPEKIKLPFKATIIKAKNDDVINHDSRKQNWENYFYKSKTEIFAGNHFSLVKEPDAEWIETITWE